MGKGLDFNWIWPGQAKTMKNANKILKTTKKLHAKDKIEEAPSDKKVNEPMIPAPIEQKKHVSLERS